MLIFHRTVGYVSMCLFYIVLSGCTSQATYQPLTQTLESTKQSNAEIITATSIPATTGPSSTFPSTVKSAGAPTFVPSPSDTPTFSKPVNTHTPNAQTMLTEQAIALKQTQIASFSANCDDANSYYTVISPKGNWLAFSCGNKRDQTMQVYSKTGKKWVVQFKDYVSKEFIRDGQTPMGSLYPVHWTNDEEYLFFQSAISFSGGGTCFYHGFGQGVYRLELDNGTVSTTLSPLIFPDQYLISFSPNGRWLAYNSNVPKILNLQTGEEIVLQEGKNRVGDFAWSPDSSNLAYGTCLPSEDYSTSKKSSIRIFSLDIRKAKTILETEIGFLRIVLGEANSLKIYDEYTNNRPEYLYFDWGTEQVNTLTVTPTP